MAISTSAENPSPPHPKSKFTTFVGDRKTESGLFDKQQFGPLAGKQKTTISRAMENQFDESVGEAKVRGELINGDPVFVRCTQGVAGK